MNRTWQIADIIAANVYNTLHSMLHYCGTNTTSFTFRGISGNTIPPQHFAHFCYLSGQYDILTRKLPPLSLFPPQCHFTLICNGSRIRKKLRCQKIRYFIILKIIFQLTPNISLEQLGTISLFSVRERIRNKKPEIKPNIDQNRPDHFRPMKFKA